MQERLIIIQPNLLDPVLKRFVVDERGGREDEPSILPGSHLVPLFGHASLFHDLVEDLLVKCVNNMCLEEFHMVLDEGTIQRPKVDIPLIAEPLVDILCCLLTPDEKDHLEDDVCHVLDVNQATRLAIEPVEDAPELAAAETGDAPTDITVPRQ